MKVSTRGRYGLRAMIEIAMHYNDEPILLKDIASSQDLSLKYLDRIITPLRSAGYIVRRGGGYILTKSPSEISAYDIVSMIEGVLNPVECIDSPDICERSNRCAAREVWKEVGDSYKRILGSLTLDDLARRQRNLNENAH